MAVRFNTPLLYQDLDAARRRKRITLYKVSKRINITLSTLNRIHSGEVREITVTSLARIIDFIGNTDISKYIYDDGE